MLKIKKLQIKKLKYILIIATKPSVTKQNDKNYWLWYTFVRGGKKNVMYNLCKYDKYKYPMLCGIYATHWLERRNILRGRELNNNLNK